jgi:hypothetical protein
LALGDGDCWPFGPSLEQCEDRQLTTVYAGSNGATAYVGSVPKVPRTPAGYYAATFYNRTDIRNVNVAVYVQTADGGRDVSATPLITLTNKYPDDSTEWFAPYVPGTKVRVDFTYLQLSNNLEGKDVLVHRVEQIETAYLPTGGSHLYWIKGAAKFQFVKSGIFGVHTSLEPTDYPG